MVFRILTEASGSLTSGYLIKAIKEAGHQAVASDVDQECFGRYLADDFIGMPPSSDPDLWGKIERLLEAHQVDIVIPSLDETLLGWAERKLYFERKGIHVITSDPYSVAVCQDKWLTYGFFVRHGIATPRSSLAQDYPLIKPRLGRGAVGVEITDKQVDMEGMISQELLKGVEYTVDIFCDKNGEPVYIVPRRRQGVRDGKSTGGIVERNELIAEGIQKICASTKFIGPLNIQCFVDDSGSVTFLEVNPRIAGGMALGFAATENWIALIERSLLRGETVIPKPVAYGMRMRRYYAEIFIPGH